MFEQQKLQGYWRPITAPRRPCISFCEGRSFECGPYLNRNQPLRSLRMTDYPLSSLPKYRNCTHSFFEMEATCPSYPCIHTGFHDKDWLADFEDYLRDVDFYYRLWNSFKEPEAYRGGLSAEERAECEKKYERCQRLCEK